MSGFVRLPYELIDSGMLSQNEFTVYISLLRHRDHRTGQCWPSYATIAREARVSRSTAIRVVRALEASGIVNVVAAGGRTSRSNVYAVTLFEGVGWPGGVSATPPGVAADRPGVSPTPAGFQSGTPDGVTLNRELDPVNSIQEEEPVSRPRLTLVADDPPPPTCDRHLGGTDRPCAACGEARRRREEFDRRERLENVRAEREAREHAAAREFEVIRSCSLCDDRGYRGALPCRHDPDADAVNQRGIAKCRKALVTTKGVS